MIDSPFCVVLFLFYYFSSSRAKNTNYATVQYYSNIYEHGVSAEIGRNLISLNYVSFEVVM